MIWITGEPVLRIRRRCSKAAESIGEFKDRQYDLLADHVRKYVDIEKLINIMQS